MAEKNVFKKLLKEIGCRADGCAYTVRLKGGKFVPQHIRIDSISVYPNGKCFLNTSLGVDGYLYKTLEECQKELPKFKAIRIGDYVIFGKSDCKSLQKVELIGEQ